MLYLSVRDDGVGGADGGAGLTGLRDGVTALGGDMRLVSPGGGGTRLDVSLPLTPASLGVTAR